MAGRPAQGWRQLISRDTHRQRMRTLRQFFERIIEWDWPDAPARNPVIAGDIPKKPEPLPKFLDDRDAARLMAAARASSDPRDRLVVELLARTGMRAGELADLEADAVVQIGDGHWLRIPLGKLRNDRYVPLHPELVDAPGRLDRSQPRAHPPPPAACSPTTAARWTGTSSAASSPASAAPPASRRPPPPAAPHPGHPGHQPRHAPGSHRRAARPPHDGDDPHLRPDRQPRRRRRIRTRSAPRSTPSTASRPSCPPTTRPPAWPGCAAKPTPACSATAYAPGPPSSTAGWNPPAKPAPTSSTSTEFMPILIRQRDHAQDHGQADRAALFEQAHPERGPDPLTTITRITPTRRARRSCQTGSRRHHLDERGNRGCGRARVHRRRGRALRHGAPASRRGWVSWASPSTATATTPSAATATSAPPGRQHERW